MCGVFGWVSRKSLLSEGDILAARSATDMLTHRGPDFGGKWNDHKVFLGHRRLSIIDLSEAAHQPFIDKTGRYVLVFNGEIYNYLELKRELENLGETFRTNSDTEVMLVALIRWGVDALGKFDGMFAAGFHDRETGTHLLFRDPLGQKPLYVWDTPERVIYGSELRSIINLPAFTWRVDVPSFYRFLMNSYYACDDTPIEGIRKLLPGHGLEITEQGSRQFRYWDSLPGDDIADMTEGGAVDKFSELFSNSCARSMRTDVPFGVFLSGGIDSSLVADFCNEINPDVRSFSVAMGEADFDESHKAVTVAKHLGIDDHHIFSMNMDSVIDAMSDVLTSNDEPHGDPGFVNAYFLAKSCRPHLTVALAGDGGDELFAGYLPFAGLGGVPWLKKLPGFLVGAMKSALTVIPASDRYLGLRFKAQSYLQGFPASDAARFPLWLASMESAELEKLCDRAGSGFFDGSRENAPAFLKIGQLTMPVRGRTQIQQLLYFYQKVFLPEFVCMHTDRAAMMFGLEVRSPLLSPELISFANRLPDRLKLKGSDPKWLLKCVARKRGLPRSIIQQKKQGFTFPLARWLKSSLNPMLDDLTNTEEWREDGLVDVNFVAAIKSAHLSGTANNYRILYNLMAFRAWRRKYPNVLIS